MQLLVHCLSLGTVIDAMQQWIRGKSRVGLQVL